MALRDHSPRVRMLPGLRLFAACTTQRRTRPREDQDLRHKGEDLLAKHQRSDTLHDTMGKRQQHALSWLVLCLCIARALALGELYSFGDNRFAATGFDDVPAHSKPREIPYFSSNKVLWYSAGESHSCAITATGDLVTFGSREEYALGDGSFTGQTTEPSRTGGTAPATQFQSCSAGRDFTLAVSAAGQVWGWGLNDERQAGSPTDDTIEFPRIISADEDIVFTRVSAGSDFALLLTDQGLLMCMGHNENNKCANTGAMIEPAAAIPFFTSHVVTDMSAGVSHSLAVTDAGDVYAWGSNGNGQITGNMMDGLTPNLVSGIAGARVAAGDATSYIIDTNGVLWGWGAAGINGIDSASDATAPVALTLNKALRFVSVSASTHGLALADVDTGGQALFTWGSNVYLQTGRSDRSDKIVQLDVDFPIATAPFAESAGATHSLIAQPLVVPFPWLTVVLISLGVLVFIAASAMLYVWVTRSPTNQHARAIRNATKVADSSHATNGKSSVLSGRSGRATAASGAGKASTRRHQTKGPGLVLETSGRRMRDAQGEGHGRSTARDALAEDLARVDAAVASGGGAAQRNRSPSPHRSGSPSKRRRSSGKGSSGRHRSGGSSGRRRSRGKAAQVVDLYPIQDVVSNAPSKYRSVTSEMAPDIQLIRPQSIAAVSTVSQTSDISRSSGVAVDLGPEDDFDDEPLEMTTPETAGSGEGNDAVDDGDGLVASGDETLHGHDGRDDDVLPA